MVNRQIGVEHTKNVIVFDPLLMGHVIRRMRSGRVRIFNGNQWKTLYLTNQERIGMGYSNVFLNTGPCIIFANNFNYIHRRATEMHSE